MSSKKQKIVPLKIESGETIGNAMTRAINQIEEKDIEEIQFSPVVRGEKIISDPFTITKAYFNEKIR